MKIKFVHRQPDTQFYWFLVNRRKVGLSLEHGKFPHFYKVSLSKSLSPKNFWLFTDPYQPDELAQDTQDEIVNMAKAMSRLTQ